MRFILALALLLAASSARADCPGGVCRLRAGQPVRNAVKAPAIVAGKAVKGAARVAKAAVVLPVRVVKGCAHAVREHKPVRRLCGRVLWRASHPLGGRLCGRRRCH